MTFNVLPYIMRCKYLYLLFETKNRIILYLWCNRNGVLHKKTTLILGFSHKLYNI